MPRESSIGEGFLCGRVVDARGAPVAAAAIRARHAHTLEISGEARSGGGGRFRIGPLIARCEWRLFASAPSIGHERLDGLVVFPGIDHDVGDVVLVDGVVFSGAVIDEVGAPIAGARVTIESDFATLRATVEGWGDPVEVVTDANGRFVSPRVPASFGVERIDAPGRVSKQLEMLDRRPGLVRDCGAIVLASDVPIRGRVVARDGSPIAGATVTCATDHANRATTASDGRFEIRGEGLDARSVSVSADDFLRGRSSLGKRRESLTIVLEHAPVVSGRVVSADGAPVRPDHLSIGLVQRTRPQLLVLNRHESQIAEDGTFRVAFDDGGDYSLYVRASGFEDVWTLLRDVDPARGLAGVEVRMHRVDSGIGRPIRSTVHGRFTATPDAPAFGLASLWRLQPSLGRGNEPVVRGATLPRVGFMSDVQPLAADGAFRFDDVGSFAFWIRVDRIGRAPCIGGPFEVALAGERRVQIADAAPATLRALVSAPDGFADALWAIASTEGPFDFCSRVARNGRLAMELPPGRYELRVGADGLSMRRMVESALAEAEGRDATSTDGVLARFEARAGETLDLGDLPSAAR